MHTTDEILAAVAEAVHEIAGPDVHEVRPDKSFADDLDVDSLAMVEITLALEERLGVAIPDSEAKNLVTVGDAVEWIGAAQTGAAA
ncbi:acyl carrier protein [Streptomyces populi]|uniref:Acyl carrier protein n=1 Tax=Streptomyces populi TaxID=2058924 RepID=A0A2I0SHC4_9ACTN|nr:acyl carrier protein [Streptomyces populi]PKT69311.1 acyl carrier protein [Streptomyces populi]